MTESAAQSAERKRLARLAADRRAAVTMLQIAASTCRYAASQLASGTGPAEARQAALFVAGDLAATAEALRRLARPGPGERRQLTVQLAAPGMTTKQIAAQLGVSDRAVRYYVAGRPRPGRTANGAATGVGQRRRQLAAGSVADRGLNRVAHAAVGHGADPPGFRLRCAIVVQPYRLGRGRASGRHYAPLGVPLTNVSSAPNERGHADLGERGPGLCCAPLLRCGMHARVRVAGLDGAPRPGPPAASSAVL